jgi:hypothetical protein
MTRRPHLSDGAFQALRDGEGLLRRRLAARAHLLRCAACAARFRAVAAAARRTGALLDIEGPQPDVEDAWQRFLVRSGLRSRLVPSLVLRGWPIGAVAAAAAAVLTVAVLHRPGSTDLVSRLYSLSSQNRLAPKDATPRDREFARSIMTLEERGALHRISDVCCADRDGEGPADDGVLTVALTGSRSPVVILYEDTERTGRFQPGDVILMVSRPGLSAAAGDGRGSL